MRTFSLILVIFLYIGSLSGQDISFFREDLKFQLEENYFKVDGLYFFRNYGNIEIRKMMFYPFPDVEKFGDITFIEIQKKDDTTSQIATISKKGALFKLFIDPNSEVAYHIRYSQHLISDQAKYIITTTHLWGKGFEQAEYKLEFPEHIKIDSSSILPDSIIRLQKINRYTWKRINFMPDVDFMFWFSQNL